MPFWKLTEILHAAIQDRGIAPDSESVIQVTHRKRCVDNGLIFEHAVRLQNRN
ncbi:MAG: hypothetical protein ACRD3V_01450 [Vicinamibacteria bacterium]